LGLTRFAPFARRTLALWERGGEARRLVGAVLAARREVFDRVGGFDEKYPFEYEETDWEIRVRRAGLFAPVPSGGPRAPPVRAQRRAQPGRRRRGGRVAAAVPRAALRRVRAASSSEGGGAADRHAVPEAKAGSLSPPSPSGPAPGSRCRPPEPRPVARRRRSMPTFGCRTK
jgi:hypothetical protein